jgi:hypothetical protein
MSFRPSLLQVGSRKGLWSPIFGEPKGILPNIINGFLKMTFASSSPLSPAMQSVSTGMRRNEGGVIATPAPIASEALVRIAALYAVESDIRGLTTDERRRSGEFLITSAKRLLQQNLPLPD